MRICLTYLPVLAGILFHTQLAYATLDINQADAPQLASLKGIGQAKARAIIEERDRNGPFLDASDLTRVKGIGQPLADTLGHAVTFEHPQPDVTHP